MVSQTIIEKVKQRRSQMLVHSYLYYWEDITIIDDHTWQRWADELTELHKTCNNINFYDEIFSDWDGSTGVHLPKNDGWVQQKAWKLVRYVESCR